MVKAIAKPVVLFFLERLVRWRLRKIDPTVVGVTGSVGKTSTKDAIFHVLSQDTPTLRNEQSYNSEFGLMLAVLEQKSGYSSPRKWLRALAEGFWDTWTLKAAPYENLVLEMGADKPGDIEYLVERVRPDIGVVTNIKPVHLAEGQFSSLEDIFLEKSKLVKAVPKEGWAVLNCDDPHLVRLEESLSARVLFYGTSPKAHLRADNIHSSTEGLRFTLTYDNKSHEVRLPHIIGKHHAYVVLPAIAVGFLKGLPFYKIEKALLSYRLPPGRMNLIEGRGGSLLIDSSYNASPDTMMAALEVLGEMSGRKIAALGSMNELGHHSEREHRRVGKRVPGVADMLITVGTEAGHYASAALAEGMPADRVQSFSTAEEAGEFLKKEVREGDWVLAKGSQNNVRMEYLVKALMKHPEQAERLLVRQTDYWQSH